MPNEQTETPKQICTLRILFPIETDEDAISYKQKITSILSQIPDAQINFSLTTVPKTLPPALRQS